jgi:hypothetical protein
VRRRKKGLLNRQDVCNLAEEFKRGLVSMRRVTYFLVVDPAGNEKPGAFRKSGSVRARAPGAGN